MNAFSPIPAPRIVEKKPDAIRSVNEWRGQCVHLYAEAEQAIAAALLRLNARDAAYTLPHLGGQRSSALRHALSASPLSPGARALDAHAPLELQHPLFCPATARVRLEPPGRWTVELCKVGSEGKDVVTVKQEEAEAFLAELKATVRTLQANLAPITPELT